MQSQDSLPPLSTDLIRKLESIYPVRCIKAGETLEAAHRYAGSRAVVEFLLALEANVPDTQVIR